MNLLELLKKLNPNFKEFIHQDFIDEHNHIVGCKTYAILEDGSTFSGGSASNRELSIRIAVAEAFERSYVHQLFQNEQLKHEFDLINFPSSSGFAAGFDESSTRFRSVCEGLERWAWSKWIDDHYFIPQIDPDLSQLSELSKHLLKSFEETFWYQKSIQVNLSPSEKLDLTIVIFLGCHKDGIFPGSRVSIKKDDLFQHPIIEAHRNLTNSILNQKIPLNEISNILQKRINYFSTHKLIALKQIQSAYIQNWPQPELHLLKKVSTDSPQIFMYRCLFKNFKGWHLGEVDRFVY